MQQQRPRLLLLLVASAVTMFARCALCQQPDILAGALIGQAAESMSTIINAAGNLATSLSQPTAAAVKLPQCPQASGIMTTAGGFPDNWARLTAEAQASHPINLPIMQLAYTAYQTPATFEGCVRQWGIDSMQTIVKTVPSFYSNAVAYIMRTAGNERLFVVFKGSDATNFMQNMQCAHTEPLGDQFGAGSSDLRLHEGFWAGWKTLEKDVTAAVLSFVKEAPKGKIYIVGHSLGAALASIAALRLSTSILPSGNEVGGVWLLASPRVGNPTWKAMYNAVLLPRTLRVSNHLDFATRVPRQQQSCSASGGILNLLAPTALYAYAHVGRSLLMCPTSNGLASWSIAGMGSEVVECVPGQDPDGSGATHLLGSYFDSWRRGYFGRYGGSTLANDPRVAAVLCEQCTMRRGTRMSQIAVPARAGGPVTCTEDASCTSQVAWEAVTSVRQTSTVKFGEGMSVCNAFICSDA